MANAPQMTVQEAVAALAALCKPGEAAFTMITASEGLSWCVASEETAHSVARTTAGEGDPGVLGVAVITADGTLTEYEVTR
jgi:hypothetical protein